MIYESEEKDTLIESIQHLGGKVRCCWNEYGHADYFDSNVCMYLYLISEMDDEN